MDSMILHTLEASACRSPAEVAYIITVTFPVSSFVAELISRLEISGAGLVRSEFRRLIRSSAIFLESLVIFRTISGASGITTDGQLVLIKDTVFSKNLNYLQRGLVQAVLLVLVRQVQAVD